ncbi:MAG: hypothetical protein J0H92_08975 [Sphingobacteriales bacterium]|nr:hypothetical protein [Sphingobacteriales bacterium]OJW33563.1 MAG: hypothetical protein BGO54_09945 [Sphingobacteriales bacterium 46-32]
MLARKLKERVEALKLNLQGKTVLTEAASGPYVVTPVLAALAGARVFAYSRTTRYGTVEEVFESTRKLADEAGVEINLITEITPEIVAEADIITNSGHLRPLNREKLQYAKNGLVIPLMYEAWEWREADMDIQYIRERGFQLGATNERHPDIDVFNYLGDMAVRQIFDAGTCPYQNRFILLCNNDFGPYMAKVIARNCEELLVIDKDENRDKYELSDNIVWAGGFPEIDIPGNFRNAEAVIFTAYPFDKVWIDHGGPIEVADLARQLNDPFILRYAGDVNTDALQKQGIRYFPEHVHSGHMGILPSAVGNDPIIRLQAGGLKAAEALVTGQHFYKDLPIVELI